MAYIEPNSELRLLAGINIDQDYNHTLFFNSREKQATFFKSRTVKTFDKLSYQRKERGYIRVNCIPEEVYGCNYMMYKNTNFDPQNLERWIYCFVESIEYINNNCAEIRYTVDRMQTWMFDYKLGDCLVDREHTLTDVPGQFVFPENITPFDYAYHSTMRFQYLPATYAAVLYLTEPLDSPDEGYDIYQLNIENGEHLYGMTPTNLYVYPGIALSEADFDRYFNGNDEYFCAFKYHNPTDQSNVPPTLTHILRLIADKKFSTIGGGVSEISAVAGVFVVPIEALKINTQFIREESVPLNLNNIVGGRTTLPVTRFDRLIYGDETYIPRNGKLLTYPFAYYRLSDYNGNAQDLRIEYFGDDERYNKINIDQSWLGPSSTIAYPINYKDVARNKFNSIYITRSFGVGYTGNNLTEFLNRNTWSMIGKVASNFSGLPMASADYFVGSAKANALLNEAHNTMDVVNSLQGTISPSTREIGARVGSADTQKAFAIQNSVGRNLGNSAVNAMTSTASDLMGFGIGMMTAQAIPDKAYVTTSPDNFIAGDGFDGIALFAMIPVKQSAQQIDDYFDRFGYKLLTTHRPYVDEAKTGDRPVSDLRGVWNYIKTVDCVVHHSNPDSAAIGYSAQDEAIIASIYNKGITFWFDNEKIGDYNTYRNANSIFNPQPGPTPPPVPTTKNGIDISRVNVNCYWNDEIDNWSPVTAFDMDSVKNSGGDYAILRIGGADEYGDTTDVQQGFYFDGAFESSYQAARAAGLKVGAYYLVNCMTVQEAVAEVNHIVSLFQQFNYPVLEGGFWLDIELNAVPEGKTRRFTSASASVQNAMIAELKAGIVNGIAPYAETFVGLYTNPSGLEHYGFKSLSVYAQTPLWLAYWSDYYDKGNPPEHILEKIRQLPDYPAIWQYGQNKLGVRAYNGTLVDGDYIYPPGWTPSQQ